MKEEIRTHVNNLFENVQNTKRAYDLKEELISNLLDKYNDFVKEGKTEKEAFDNAISSIGDVNELIADLEKSNPINRENMQAERKKTAFVVSLCVGLYIFSLISAIFVSEVIGSDDGAALTFISIAGITTCILIYHFMSRPKYVRYDDTIVEDFKEWKSNNDKNKAIKDAIISIFWTVIVALYFLISFLFSSWAFSWIIFIIGGAISQAIGLLFKLKE